MKYLLAIIAVIIISCSENNNDPSGIPLFSYENDNAKIFSNGMTAIYRLEVIDGEKLTYKFYYDNTADNEPEVEAFYLKITHQFDNNQTVTAYSHSGKAYYAYVDNEPGTQEIRYDNIEGKTYYGKQVIFEDEENILDLVLELDNDLGFFRIKVGYDYFIDSQLIKP